MTSNPNRNATTPASTPIAPDSEEIIRQLERFPVEALEAALIVLAARNQRMSR
jgi:hypothetical protein